MQHEPTLLHPSKLRFPFVKPSFVALLRLFGEKMQGARMTSTIPAHVYEVRPRKDHRGVDLVSDVLPFDPARYVRSNRAPPTQTATR
jgi:hypothetical protein